LSLNEDDKKYKMCLKMSEDDLKTTLGRSFFEEIQTQYIANTFTAANETLYEDYLKDALAWQTYFNYLKFANTNATPTGIRSFNDENSSIADNIEMYALLKNVKEQANRYKYQMINFLKETQSNDSTAYPLWTDDCREYMSFAITSVDKCSDALIKVNKATSTNE
jgi:hypothetical protein